MGTGRVRYRLEFLATDLRRVQESIYELGSPPPIPNVGDTLMLDGDWAVVDRKFVYNPDEIVIIFFCEPQ